MPTRWLGVCVLAAPADAAARHRFRCRAMWWPGTGDVARSAASTSPPGLTRWCARPLGSTVLAAGRQVVLTGRGLEGISMLVQAPTDSALNLGSSQGVCGGCVRRHTENHGHRSRRDRSPHRGGKVFSERPPNAPRLVVWSPRWEQPAGWPQVHVTADKVGVLAGRAG